MAAPALLAAGARAAVGPRAGAAGAGVGPPVVVGLEVAAGAGPPAVVGTEVAAGTDAAAGPGAVVGVAGGSRTLLVNAATAPPPGHWITGFALGASAPPTRPTVLDLVNLDLMKYFKLATLR